MNHDLSSQQTNRLLLDLLKKTQFSVFSSYYELLEGTVSVGTDIIGNPYYFLGKGKYSTSGYWLNICVGSDSDMAQYKLSFKSDFRKTNNRQQWFIVVEQGLCAISNEIKDCYTLRIRLVSNNLPIKEYYMPELHLGSDIQYEGNDVSIASIHGNGSWYVIKSKDNLFENKTVRATDLAVLSENGTYVAIQNYVSGQHYPALPAPAKSKNGMPMLSWQIHFPQHIYIHPWACTYAREKQTFPIKDSER